MRAIVVEATWAEFEAGDWRSKVTPAAAVGSCLGWIAAGVPIIMAGDHARAGRTIARLLFIAARRRWRELRALAGRPGDDATERPSGLTVAAAPMIDGADHQRMTRY